MNNSSIAVIHSLDLILKESYMDPECKKWSLKSVGWKVGRQGRELFGFATFTVHEQQIETICQHMHYFISEHPS